MNFEISTVTGNKYLSFYVVGFPSYCGGQIYHGFSNYKPNTWGPSAIKTTAEGLWEAFCRSLTNTTTFMVNYATAAATNLLFESVPKEPVKFGGRWYIATLSEPYTAATGNVLRHLIVVRTTVAPKGVIAPVSTPVVKKAAVKKSIVKRPTPKRVVK